MSFKGNISTCPSKKLTISELQARTKRCRCQPKWTHVKTRTAGKLLKTTTSRLLNTFPEHWGSTKTIQVWGFFFLRGGVIDLVCQPVTNTPPSVVTGEKEQAVQWYKKGIAELERGIAVELTREGNVHTNIQLMWVIDLSSMACSQEISMKEPGDFKIKWSPISAWQRIGSPS